MSTYFTKIESDSNSLLILKIRNITLAIFYLVTMILLMVFAYFFQESLILLLSKPLLYVILGALIIFDLYLTAKSVFGKAVVNISKAQTTVFEGIFGIGKRNSIVTQHIQNVFVSRTESAGGTSSGTVSPKAINQHIIFQTDSEFKLLRNQISTEKLQKFCKEINQTLSKYQS